MTKVGIIGAMQCEIDSIVSCMSVSSQSTIANRMFYIGRIQNTDVVVCLSGCGKVNAATAAQILISRYNVDCIITTGVAGSLRSDIPTGSVIVALDAIYHDVDCTAVGYEPCTLPESHSRYSTDDTLQLIAGQAALLSCHDSSLIVIGTVASGDSFIASTEDRRRIFNITSADCVDMESCAIVQTCECNNTPCAIIRVISDGSDDFQLDAYNSFESYAAAIGSTITLKFIEIIAAAEV